MTPVGVLVSGRGSNLAALIARARRPGCPFHIACVVSDQPGALALGLARDAGIPAFTLEKLPGLRKSDFEAGIVDLLRAHGVRVVALAGYMRILGKTLLSAFPGRVLNIHPSLLPAFPGLHAQEQAHAAGVRHAGCTVHLVDAGMDTGPILDQACFRVPPGLDADSFSARILEHEHRLYPEVLARFCRHEFMVLDGRVRTFSPPSALRPVWEAFCAAHLAGAEPPGRPEVAVSACLLGFPCRYDGQSRAAPELIAALPRPGVLPVCPEVLAGFGVPRPRIQLENEPGPAIARSPLIRDEHGADVSAALVEAVDRVAAWCRAAGVRAAFLKENSPSCGTLRVPCRGARVAGPGPLALRLGDAGIRIFTEENLEEGIAWLNVNINIPSADPGPPPPSGAGKI